MFIILPAEITAENVCKTKENRGLTVCGEEIKLSQYANDTTLNLDGSEESLRESLKLLDDFGKMSGLKLNCGKTEALWIGSKTNCNLRLCPENNFKWPFKKVKALGVWLSTDAEITVSQNYKEKLEKMRAILGCWKFRRLSLLGKVMVLKSLVASQLVYISLPSLHTMKQFKKSTHYSTNLCGAIK